jgi:hypothetical protein
MLARIGVWVVALLLSPGLERLLVVCTSPHAGSHIELAHANGSCCTHEHERAAEEPAPGLGDRIDADAPRCVDASLELGKGPLPKPVQLEDGGQSALELVLPFAPIGPEPLVAAIRPPSTGPPRPDPRTALRASTLLLV